MSVRPRAVSDWDQGYLGPVTIAVFIEVGWIQEWPLMWTPEGRHALRSGWGIWRADRQHLPVEVERKPDGVLYWHGRIVRKP